MKQLTPEKATRMKKLGEALAYAYIHGSEEELQQIADLTKAFFEEMSAKYDK